MVQQEDEKRSAEKSRLEPQRYNEVVRDAELGTITLVRCQFEIKADYFASKLRNRKNGHGLKFSYSNEVEDIDFDSEEGVLGANFVWNLTVRAGNKVVVKLVADYVCFYSNVKGADRVAAAAYLKRVGRFATFPYFRALASQMSWASEADLPVLPVLRERRVAKRGGGEKEAAANQVQVKASSRKRRRPVTPKS